MRILPAASLTVLVAYVGIGALLDSVIFPERPPGPEFYPPVGYQFVSRLEGFRQTVLQREDGRFWLELTLDPHAPGPPEHVHTSFAENFAVVEGTLSLLVNGQRRIVQAGERLAVWPGTPHKPFNETASRVVVRGPVEPEFAMPDRFSVFLTQAYGFFDERPSHSRPPKALLQMSRFSPTYDVWLARPPIAGQKVLFFLIRPTARLLGYRSHYERFKPAG